MLTLDGDHSLGSPEPFKDLAILLAPGFPGLEEEQVEALHLQGVAKQPCRAGARDVTQFQARCDMEAIDEDLEPQMQARS